MMGIAQSNYHIQRDYELAILCPECGCHAIDVLSLPSPGRRNSWWGGADGKARCVRCGLVFRIIEKLNEND